MMLRCQMASQYTEVFNLNNATNTVFHDNIFCQLLCTSDANAYIHVGSTHDAAPTAVTAAGNQ